MLNDGTVLKEYDVPLQCDACKGQKPPFLVRLTTKKIHVQCGCGHEGEMTFEALEAFAVKAYAKEEEERKARLAEERAEQKQLQAEASADCPDRY